MTGGCERNKTCNLGDFLGASYFGRWCLQALVSSVCKTSSNVTAQNNVHTES